jgi:molybdopterin synthase catalytic subunit
MTALKSLFSRPSQGGDVTVSKESPRVRIQTLDFDLSTEVAALRAEVAGVGAVVSFLGTVREYSGGDAIHGMTLEHYPGMTESMIEAMIHAAQMRFNILAARVIHRVGPLLPQDQIVWVGVAASHRGDAFAACEYLMDYLKTQAPFWKKEHTADGGRWVDARASDDAALTKWLPASPTIVP